MDLFGTKKRKATQYAVDFVRPILGPIQHNYGLPPQFWADHFVLGYTGFTIASCSKFVANDLSYSDKGHVLADVFTTLSNQNGVAIAARATELMSARTPDCVQGSENASLVFGYFIGILPDEDVIVQKAKAIVRGLGNDSDRDEIRGALVYLLFNQVIKDRFKLGRKQ